MESSKDPNEDVRTIDSVLNILSIILAPTITPLLGYYCIVNEYIQDYTAWPEVGKLVSIASALGLLVTLSVNGIRYRHKRKDAIYLSLMFWIILAYFMITGWNEISNRFIHEQNISSNLFWHYFSIYVVVNALLSLFIACTPEIYNLFRKHISSGIAS